MQIIARSAFLQKAGNTIDEYEDACWPVDPFDCEVTDFRCAVTDGATETSFADVWARLLATNFSRMNTTDLNDSLSGLQQIWSEQVNSKPLPWYAGEKVKDGAFSTLLGLTILEDDTNPQSRQWSAIAIGDSCLFHVRDDRLVYAFPLDNSELFNSRPVLLSSNPEFNQKAIERLQSSVGTAISGDEFYLMTDALACWFLKDVESDGLPWQTLREFADPDQYESFVEWISQLRDAKLIRNDDVTLLHVEMR